MIPLVLRPAIALALVFAVALAAIRAQSRNDETLRAFLADTACTAPCLMGIQPGVTTPDKAIAILEAHPWVKRVMGEASSPAPRIFWQWSERAPDFLEKDASGLPTSYLYVQDGVIRYIRLQTDLTYGEVRLLMGAPGSGTFIVSSPNSTTPTYKHSAGYFGGLVVFDTETSCPINPSAFWNAPIVATYNDGSYPSLSSMPAYDLDHWLERRSCQP
jgi:hypothetical protein